jgi:hypothetical protein
MRPPKHLAADAEHVETPSGPGERFAGYGVMGLPFRSGHVLAMRRFAASSVGPAYTSVWHRDPAGDWVFWQDGRAEQACPRYFSAALSSSRTVGIELSWPADETLRIAIPEVELEWTATMATTAATRGLNGIGRVLPERAWRSAAVLKAMAPIAGRALRAGRIGMVGVAPNGQSFITNPQTVFVVEASEARLGAEPLGPPGPLGDQARLGDFWIPQRGILAFGRAFFEPS